MIRNAAILATALLAASTARAQSVYTYTQSSNTGSNLAIGIPPPMPVASQTPLAGFRDHASLFARHQDLMLLHDEVTGQQVGTTTAGRAVWAYVLTGTNALPGGGPKPGVLMVSGVHAREWGPPEVTTGIMERLVANKADASFHQYLLENLRIVIVPVLNVDGFMQSQRFPAQFTSTSKSGAADDGRQRRKNMRGVDEVITTMPDRQLGVDVNRNHQSGYGGGSSDPTSQTYYGTGVSSEPESSALYGAEAIVPGNRLRLYTDNHSYTKVFITPQTSNTRTNTLRGQIVPRIIAAVGTVNGSNYSYSPSSAPVGTTDEYFAYKYDAISYTLEIEPASGLTEYGGNSVWGGGFILPESQVARVRDDIARGQLFAWYLISGPPSVRAFRITHVGSGTVVQEGSWDAASPTTRTLNRTANLPLVKGETYSLWLSFTKPMRWRDTGGSIANHTGQSVALSPTITLTGTGDGGSPINISVPLTTAAWRNTPGGAGTGYLQYKDDALLASFTVPGSIPVAASATVTLNITAQDMSGLALDARPETIVDWASGGWSNYENAAGTAGDVGGTDSRITFGVQAPAAGMGAWQDY